MFTPKVFYSEDYGNWKSQNEVIHLENDGHLTFKITHFTP